MNDFRVYEDIEIIRTLLDLSVQEFAELIGVSRMTLHRWKDTEARISEERLEAVYGAAFRKGIRLNRIKEQLYREDMREGHKLLFHGAKTHLSGEIDVVHARTNNDFGSGFYCGERLEQAAAFVAGFPKSSLYMIDLQTDGLRTKAYHVDQEWMMTIAYFRGRLKGFENRSAVRRLTEALEGVDLVRAPIADNRMFEIIDSFIDGEITDEQCRHCLSATNLGDQYILLTQKAAAHARVLEHCYLAEEEKAEHLKLRQKEHEVGMDKVKAARRLYRGQGSYIEEILE